MKNSKIMKFLVIALIAVSSFVTAANANAQVRVSVGQRPARHRVVVVKRRPVMRHHRKVVVVRHRRVVRPRHRY